MPDIRLTVDLYPQPRTGGAIGEVSDSDWIGMRHQDVGQAQAWYYPADHLVVQWECLPEEWCSTDDPRTDTTLQALWHGFERVLRNRLPDAIGIVTSSPVNPVVPPPPSCASLWYGQATSNSKTRRVSNPHVSEDALESEQDAGSTPIG